MSEVRPAASLTSSLLARRGDARPAMRRQAITHLHLPVTPHDDLGWNDIGDEELEPTLTSLAGMTPGSRPSTDYDDEQDDFEGRDPGAHEHHGDAMSPLTHHLEEIARRIAAPAARTSPSPAAEKPAAVRRAPSTEPGLSGRKAAFTLRIDAERHLRLRLLSALVHRSSQQLLIEALDALLAQHDRIEDLAGQAGMPAERRNGTTGY